MSVNQSQPNSDSFLEAKEKIHNDVSLLHQMTVIKQDKSQRNSLNKWFQDSVKNYFLEVYAAPLIMKQLKMHKVESVKLFIQSLIKKKEAKYMLLVENYYDQLVKYNKLQQFIDSLVELVLSALQIPVEAQISDSQNESNPQISYNQQKQIRKQFVGVLLHEYCNCRVRNQEVTSFYDLWNLSFPQDTIQKKKLSRYDTMRSQKQAKQTSLIDNSKAFINPQPTKIEEIDINITNSIGNSQETSSIKKSSKIQTLRFPLINFLRMKVQSSNICSTNQVIRPLLRIGIKSDNSIEKIKSEFFSKDEYNNNEQQRGDTQFLNQNKSGKENQKLKRTIGQISNSEIIIPEPRKFLKVEFQNIPNIDFKQEEEIIGFPNQNESIKKENYLPQDKKESDLIIKTSSSVEFSEDSNQQELQQCNLKYQANPTQKFFPLYQQNPSITPFNPQNQSIHAQYQQNPTIPPFSYGSQAIFYQYIPQYQQYYGINRVPKMIPSYPMIIQPYYFQSHQNPSIQHPTSFNPLNKSYCDS